MDYGYKRRKQLAKKANERLRKLEAAGFDRWAYTRAMEYIGQTLGEGRKRFSESEGKRINRTRLYSDIRAMEAFLNSESSTIKGQESIINRREMKLMSKFGIDMTTEEGKNDFYNFVDSLDFTSLDSPFKGLSGQIVDLYADAFDNVKAKKTLEKAIKDFNRGKIKKVSTIFNRVNRSLGRL